MEKLVEYFDVLRGLGLIINDVTLAGKVPITSCVHDPLPGVASMT